MAESAQPPGECAWPRHASLRVPLEAEARGPLVPWRGAPPLAPLAPEVCGYPRVLTALQLLEEGSDDEQVFCGPPSEPEEAGTAALRSLEAWGICGRAAEGAAGAGGEVHPREAARGEGAGREARPREHQRRLAEGAEARRPRELGEPQPRRAPPLIAPRGDASGDNQKFISVFQIGLEDDGDNEEFCLVKRILGKQGNNMRRIAEECSAKVRLRGIGSGFLEGADGKEVNMPLQLSVSCTDYDSYRGAVERVAALLKDLYRHYRRFARSKGMEPPDVKVDLEEVRRDDLNVDLLSQKAQRSPSQRERDRLARWRERQQLGKREGPIGAASAARPAPREGSRGRGSREADSKSVEEAGDERESAPAERKGANEPRIRAAPRMLPGGLPVPTTPAGRRAAARAGGAAAAAVASAVAREAERAERECVREERDRQREEEREERERKREGTKRGRTKCALPAGSHRTEPSLSHVASPLRAYSWAVPLRAPPPPPGPPPEDSVQVAPAKARYRWVAVPTAPGLVAGQ